MSHKRYNNNPSGKRVGDCTVRAISKALGQTWEQTYVGLTLQGFLMGDMPSADHVWGAYLRKHGFSRRILPDTCPDCYTVEDFAADHPRGVYLLAIPEHVVCVEDGDYYDTWDSGGKVPVYFWERTCE